MDQTYIKQDISEGEVEIYKVLNKLAKKYNSTFSKLFLPSYLSYNKRGKRLTLPLYVGETFNDKWHESNGGLDLGLELSTETVKVIADLMSVDLKDVLLNKKLLELPKITFDYTDAKRYYSAIARKLHEEGHISKQLLSSIIKALEYKQESALILSNGDFYPRNFIRLKDDKIVLIDWETWSSASSPFYIIDHPENVAATFFVHMWGNLAWQSKFLKELKSQFNFNEASLKKGIVIKALALSNLWLYKEDKSLVASQVKTLKKILST